MPKFNIKAQTIPTVASAYADVIGTTDNQIVEIKNELIIEDNNQHFQIHDDTVEQLAEHIVKDGQLSPCIVAPLPDGKYELIDGRHRRRAVIMAGLPTTKCIIKTDLSDQAKKTIRLTSNLIRNNDYLPSELAFAYRELAELEDMKTISEETNLSKKKIYRYIRLTYLIEPLLNRVDNGSIPVIAAVELSYLTEQQQRRLFEFMLNHSDCKITTATAREIKESPDELEAVFYEEEKVDNLSTEDNGTAEQPEKTETADSITELVDKALEPYQKPETESAKVERKVEFTEGNDSEVDNLSTEEDVSDTEQPPKTIESVQSATRGSSSVNTMVVGKDDLLYLDLEGNAHNVNEIDEHTLKIICEYVIEETQMDYYVFRFAYDVKDILRQWNEEQIKCSHGHSVCEETETGELLVLGYANWNAHKRMFDIEIENEHYIFLHKMLHDVVRRYIRKNYTVERILSVIKESAND